MHASSLAQQHDRTGSLRTTVPGVQIRSKGPGGAWSPVKIPAPGARSGHLSVFAYFVTVKSLITTKKCGPAME